MSFLDKIGYNKLKDGLTKTKEDLFGKISRLVTARKKIDEELMLREFESDLDQLCKRKRSGL